jgi:type II secretion system protein N
MNLPKLRISLPKLGASLSKLRPWQRRAAWILFFALAFLFALQRTFPSEAVKERLIMEAAARGWQVTMTDIEPSGFGGVTATGVVVETREGLKVPLDRVTAALRVLPLLLGRRQLSFDAEVFEGRVHGWAQEGKEQQRLVLSAGGVDLSRAAPVKQLSGLDLAGSLTADVDLTLDLKDATKSAGHVDLAVENGAINGGQLKVASMGGALTLPRIDLGKVVAKAVVKDGKATVEKLDAQSNDLQAGTEGLYVQMQQRLELSAVSGRARLKLADGFWEKSGTAAFRGVTEMALGRARQPDGAYAFQIFGTLAHPQARMVTPGQ